jgi:hypothetical protein
MAQDTELKTHVEEEVHDDFVSLGRDYGFENKSQFLKHLILRELYGAKLMQKNRRLPGAITGLN